MEINLLVICGYSLISSISFLLLFSIIHYLRNKPLEQQTIKDKVQIDLILSAIACILYVSTIVILKQFLPPFEHTIFLDGILLLTILLFYLVLTHCVASQVFQLLYLFYDHHMEDLNEFYAMLSCRIICLSLAVLTSGINCSLGEATCRRSSLLLYFTEDQGPADKRTAKSSIPLLIYMFVIASIQIVIEIKRKLAKIDDAKVDGMAQNAAKSLEEASRTLKSAKMIPGITLAWYPDNSGKEGKPNLCRFGF